MVAVSLDEGACILDWGLSSPHRHVNINVNHNHKVPTQEVDHQEGNCSGINRPTLYVGNSVVIQYKLGIHTLYKEVYLCMPNSHIIGCDFTGLAG